MSRYYSDLPDSAVAWEEMQNGCTICDIETNLKYRVDDMQLMVFNPLGGWEPSNKPIEWFMRARFKLVKRRESELGRDIYDDIDKEEWTRIQHDGVSHP